MSHGFHEPPPGSHAHGTLGDSDAPPAGQIHTLPEGSVLAKDGTTISWSQGPTGAITAVGLNQELNQQLVVSRYRPSATAGTDILHGGDMAAAPAAGDPQNADPVDAGPKHPGHLAGQLAGHVGNFDIGEPGNGDDPISGLQFVYSNVGQEDDPWLTIRYLADETEQTSFVEVIGIVSWARFLMKGDGDVTKVPSQVSAEFMPHHEKIAWEGDLDLTESPVRSLNRIKGWHLNAFANEFAGAAYFDALSPLLTDTFGQSATDGLPPGVVAKTAAGITGRAVVWGVCGAAAAVAGLFVVAGTAPVSVPVALAVAGSAFVGSAVASAASDLWSAATDDIQIIEPEAPPNPDLPVPVDDPTDSCFAEGTMVAIPDRGRVPIEHVSVGDLVTSREESSREQGGRRVTRTWKHLGQETVDVILDSGERVRTTSAHRFFTLDRGIISAGELQVDDRLHTLTGLPRMIVKIEPGPAGSTVYNLTVEGLHTYFVADAGLWVHNTKEEQHDDPPPADPDGSGGGGTGPSGPDDGSGDDGGTTPGGGSGSGGGSGPTPA